MLSGSLPAKVSLNRSDTTFRSVLSASGCDNVDWSNSTVSARFDGPQGLFDYASWTGPGSSYIFDAWYFDTAPGPYTLSDNTYLVDSNFTQVPVTWVNTSTSIRFSSRVASLATTWSRSNVVAFSGKIQRYTTDGSYVGYYTTYELQRHTTTSPVWKPFKTLKSHASGAIVYSYTTSAKYYYRILVRDVTTVWGVTTRAFAR